MSLIKSSLGTRGNGGFTISYFLWSPRVPRVHCYQKGILTPKSGLGLWVRIGTAGKPRRYQRVARNLAKDGSVTPPDGQEDREREDMSVRA